jgi:hypothetical protein
MAGTFAARFENCRALKRSGWRAGGPQQERAGICIHEVSGRLRWRKPAGSGRIEPRPAGLTRNFPENFPKNFRP